jgi:Tol biopolymer transport system component
LAALNHPHIAAIYGVEHVDGVRCLVLELVEGPTLADRLAAGPLPVPEALRIAGQIADALEAAHDKGIVHRDLKPANVKVTAQGKVKVLDFGLAKAFASAQAQAAGANGLTERRGHTAAGLVVGTASYMSPEQAEGRPVDKRTDVWSFAVVLYEMLTGQRLFDGKSDAHVLVHVMEQDPDWSKLPPLPSGVLALMERCLQKDPAQRLRDIGDVRLLLQASLSQPARAIDVSAAPSSAGRGWLWPAAAGAVVALAAGVALWPRPPATVTPDAVRFDIPRQADTTGAGAFIRISPDGRQLAYAALSGNGLLNIWVRSLATQEARPLPGSEGVTGIPFWSADSRYIIFTSNNRLRRVDVSGGPAQPLGDSATFAAGGFTTADGRLVYAQVGRGVLEMPFSGGTPTPVSLGEESQSAVTPSALPDGSIVYCQCVQAQAPGIYLATPGSAPRQILPDLSPVQYAPSPDPGRGYVLFLRGAAVATDAGTLMAQAIDPRNLRLLGDPVAIAERVRGFSASEGVLVYSEDAAFVGSSAPGLVRGLLTWFDRDGRIVSTVGEAGVYRALALSPGQDLLAVERGDPARNIDIYLLEFARGVTNRFTFDAANDFQPVWSPDGASVMFTRFEGRGVAAWYRRSANLAGEEELLFRARDQGALSSVSPDGRFLLFTGPLPATGDIQVVDLERVFEAREAIPVVATEFFEVNARFSPDGRWFAYASNESGQYELYVRPFNAGARPGESPGAGGRIMVSKGGATGAGGIWRADGQELYYVALDGTMMAVAVSTAPTFSVNGPPQPLFKLPAATVFFDVSRDGQRFLVPIAESAGASAPPYRVMLNWTATLN